MQLTVSSGDVVSRFIVQKSHFSRLNSRVKYSAWLPNNEGETSVFITTDLDESDIWDMGGREVALPREKTLYARGDVVAGLIADSGLSFEYDNVPPRHCNILDWPKEKSEQKMIAIDLAEASELRLNPGNSA